MRTIRCNWKAGLFLLILLSLPAALHAQVSPTSRVPLRQGLSLSAVAALWGSPQEMIEEELKRQVTWYYPALRSSPEVTLKFIGGELVISEDQHILFSGDPPLHSHNTAAGTKTLQGSQKQAVKVRAQTFMALEDHKMLAEILKDIPSTLDSPAGAGAAPAAAAPANPAQFD